MNESIDRRSFLRAAAGALGTLAVGACANRGGDTGATRAPAPAPAAPPAGQDLAVARTRTYELGPITRGRLLILGGTGFLGPHVVRAALARGHTMTLFNRGKTNPHLFPELEKLRGDRKAGDLKALAGRQWDAVIDTSGYVPRAVRQSAELLGDNVGQYVFISSISVYADPSQPRIDESSPLGTLEDVTTEEVNGETYGPLKALCERAAEDVFRGRTTVVRPGLIVGPGDPTDRFTYWPVRVARGGDVLAPGTPNDPIQIIDARDLAEWIIKTVERRHLGAYNACGPTEPLSIGRLLTICRESSKSDANFVWADAEFLAAQEVMPWMHMPVWVPPQSEFGGFGTVRFEQAVAAGLTFRPVADTVTDTLEWWKTLPKERHERLLAGKSAGISAEREAEVLAAWRESQRGKRVAARARVLSTSTESAPRRPWMPTPVYA